jgi:hypothetical protein
MVGESRGCGMVSMLSLVVVWWQHETTSGLSIVGCGSRSRQISQDLALDLSLKTSSQVVEKRTYDRPERNQNRPCMDRGSSTFLRPIISACARVRVLARESVGSTESKDVRGKSKSKSHYYFLSNIIFFHLHCY